MDILIYILAACGLGCAIYLLGSGIGSIFKKEMSTEEFINLLKEEKRKRKEESEKYYEQLHREGRIS